MNKPRKKQPPAVVRQSGAIRRNRKKGAGAGKSQKGSRLFVTTAAVGVVVLVSFLCVAGYVGITRCDYLSVTEIFVSGTNLLEEETVVRQARVQTGDNILAVNLQVVRGYLLNHPWVASVRVARRLPGTIVIEVREHSPLAVVDLGQRYFMDENRRLFKRLDDSDPIILPLITGVDYRDLDVTGRPGSDLFRAALDTIETGSRLRHLVPGMVVQQVAVDRDMGITIHTAGHVDRVRLGFDGDNDKYVKKFRRLKDLLGRMEEDAKRMPIAAVNLESPDRVVVKPEAGLAGSGNFFKGG